MRAGRLKHPVFIFISEVKEDDYGSGSKKIEKKLFDEAVMTDIQSIRESDSFVSSGTKTKSELKFVMRFIPGIDNTMSIKSDDVMHEIVEVVNPFNSNKELHIYAKVES